MIAFLDVDYRETGAVAACVLANDWVDPVPLREVVERIRQLRARRPDTAQLAMSADEITEYYRRATLFPRSDSQRERDRKFVSRLKTGPKAKRDDDYRLLKRECVKACRGDMRRARTMFLNLAFERLDAHWHTAQNAWSLLKREDAK